MGLNLGTSLSNLSRGQKALLVALPSLLIIAAAVFFFILPSIEATNRLSAEIRKQQDEIRIAQQRSAGLPALMAENERLRRTLSDLELQLPEEREVSGLLKQVSELGIRSGLQVVAWKPKEKVVHPSREVYAIPVDVEMRGNYHRFGHFFSNVTSLNRIVNIENIGAKMVDAKQQKGMPFLTVGFTAITYSSIPEQEKKELAAKEKGKDKGKETGKETDKSKAKDKKA
jgi:type IV pilus assembly protein PilO